MKKSIPTPEQMAEQLIRRGMSCMKGINEEELYREITHRLTYIGAYRLQPYWTPFLQEDIHDEKIVETDQFRPRTHWENVLHGYMFDRKLRNLFFDGVSRVEVALRAVIAQSWAELAKHERPHLNLSSYKPTYIKGGTQTPSAQDKLWKLVDGNFRRSREAYSVEYEDVRKAEALSELTRPDRAGAALTFCRMVFNTIAPLALGRKRCSRKFRASPKRLT